MMSPPIGLTLQWFLWATVTIAFVACFVSLVAGVVEAWRLYKDIRKD